MVNDEERIVNWSELPEEMWPEIGKRLNATIDHLLFRNICKSWRSSIPLPSSLTLSPPQIPIPLGNLRLTSSRIYRLEPSSSHAHDLDPAQDPSNSSSSSSRGWLIKVGESKPGPLRLLDPFTNCRVKYSRQSYPSPTFPKELNLLNFKVFELIEAYSLNYAPDYLPEAEDLELIEAYSLNYAHDYLLQDEAEASGVLISVPHVRKVMLYPSFPSKEVDDGRMVFALYWDRRLGFSKIGDENWTFMDDGKFRCDDIILHKGQLYVVDKWGTILWINYSSLKLVQFSPLLCGCGKRKHLVESGGSLYVVDMYCRGEPDNPMGMFYEALDIKVYKLDEEWGKWLDVKNLGDVLFVLGKDCNFSLSAQDYRGCEGNCIYFSQAGFSQAGSACAFRLENSTFNKSPKFFWPCPTLFHPMLKGECTG